MIQISNAQYSELIDKQTFVSEVSDAIVKTAKSSIKRIEYDVFWSTANAILCEYLVVTYIGGAIAVRNCRGNSISAVFEEISKLFNGGYYEEVSDYNYYKTDSIELQNIIRKL